MLQHVALKVPIEAKKNMQVLSYISMGERNIILSAYTM